MSLVIADGGDRLLYYDKVGGAEAEGTVEAGWMLSINEYDETGADRHLTVYPRTGLRQLDECEDRRRLEFSLNVIGRPGQRGLGMMEEASYGPL